METSLSTILILIACTLCNILTSIEGAIISVPLSRGTGLSKTSTHGPCRFLSLSTERDDEDFWFAKFSIGTSRNLSILIDTGSPDLFLNAGVYNPSDLAIDTHHEFSMSFGTVEADGSGEEVVNGTVYQDTVSLDGTELSVSSQSLGAVTFTSHPGPAFPHDGLMGFFVPGSSFGEGTNNWFSNLCLQPHILNECRFGLAMELFTSNTSEYDGTMYLGGVEKSRFFGDLSVTEKHERFVFGDLIFDDQTIHSNAKIMVDSGTTVIWGPIKYVQTLFDMAGMQSVLRQSNNSGSVVNILDGFYPCDKPPLFGFQLPSLSNASAARLSESTVISHQSRFFQIYYSAVVGNLSADDGNCTASIHGTDSSADSWIVGQQFLRGRYIDHNIKENTMGFANLIEN